MPRALSLGLDFGTSSVRCLVVDAYNGDELGTAVVGYAHGDDGVLYGDDPLLARQHPGDWFDSATEAIVSALRGIGSEAGAIVGIGVDTTGSTPVPVDARCRPLALDPRFADDLAAMAWLWKDHTSHSEAEEITELAKRMGRPFLAKCGGTYSSEWFWSKILHCARTAPHVFDAAASWVECADLIPAWLTGQSDPGTISRSICAAGHKAMFHTAWGGLPDAEFLAALDPRLADLRGRLYSGAEPSDRFAGHLRADLAGELGLLAGIPVAVGAFDAHMGAVGSGIRPGTLVKIMGTSTCDLMVGPDDGTIPDIEGVCGIVPGSILPDMLGIEAGQSAVGDLFEWVAEQLAAGADHATLNERAAELRPGESGLLMLDWNNGNRTVLVDPRLTGLLVGQTLKTTPVEIYRAAIEATAFGARRIIQQIRDAGVEVREIVTGGGIAERSPLTMQIYADVCNMPIRISRSPQTCALGAAIFGSVVGGAHQDVAAAVNAMTGFKDVVYRPNARAVAVYQSLYELYETLHDAFGDTSRHPPLDGVMKRLMAIREEAASA